MPASLFDDPRAAILAAFAFGLLVGSFLNVVILRLPRRLEWGWKRDSRELLEISEPYEPAPPGIVIEASHCPHCKHKLAIWENIPLVSFVLLRGKCRHCSATISWQYPLVELTTALLFAACVWRFGVGFESGLGLVFTGLLVALAGIDLRTGYLHDELTGPLLWIGLLASVITLYVDPVSAILGASVGYTSLWTFSALFTLIRKKVGMGHGDFKLFAALGAWCGVSSLLPVIFLSALVGAIVGSIWLLVKRKDFDTEIPFGLYLAAAGWLQFITGADWLGIWARWVLHG